MYFMLLLGVFIGMGLTMLVQDVSAKIRAYQARKQQEFEAAVAAAAAHRKSQADRAWEDVLRISNVEASRNVRSVRSTDDPFA